MTSMMDMNVVNDVEKLIRLSREHPTYECEVHFGFFFNRGDGRGDGKKNFSNYFDADMFESLLDRCCALGEQGGVWSKYSKKNDPEIFVTKYLDGERRQRMYQRGETEYTRVKSVPGIPSVCIEDPSLMIHARVSIKDEQQELSHFKDDKPPIYVRLQRRWSFYYRSKSASSTDGDTFRYDLTQLVSGTDIQTAKQHKPVYEVEIELLRPYSTSFNLTHSFLSKINDILKPTPEMIQTPVTTTAANSNNTIQRNGGEMVVPMSPIQSI